MTTIKAPGDQTTGSHGKLLMISLPELYINRELSWLAFNERVLAEAQADETPTLERMKFLAIFSSNLDGFFMVRVAGLKKMLQNGIKFTEYADGMKTAVVLEQIRRRTLALLGAQYRCLHEKVLPALATHGVRLLTMSELTAAQRQAMDQYFEDEVGPVLTPLAFDPAHPFPFLANQALCLVVIPKILELRGHGELPAIGFVEVPSVIPRLVAVKTKTKGEHCFVLLEDLIAANLASLFFGFQIDATFTIRVTRNLDYNLLENKVVDLLKSIQKEVSNREHQEVVRLEVDCHIPEGILDLLKKTLVISDKDIYRLPQPIHIPGLMDLYDLPLDLLKDEAFNPRLPKALAGNEDIFAVVAKKDLLVHHPYESFYAVTEFLNSAAQDPNVVAIKQTLYRTAGDSPIIDALIAAAKNGKQVTAVVELKARFDEKNNISWARRLERAGVSVVFGFVGLKTHGKATLVIRREASGLVRYVHVSTGNYNSSTAKLYTDVGLFTADPATGRDVSTIFNLITGFDILTDASQLQDQAITQKLETLAIGPVNLRHTFVGLIDNEIACAQQHGSGLIIAKLNGLVDKDVIDALYSASQAGVCIRIICRGICCLRPGIPGVSDNIEVISIIDRFLEHSRLYYFQAAGEEKVFLSSADWMPRNMDRRIEILCPVKDQDLKHRIVEEILQTLWSDNVKARELKSDGRYEPRAAKPGEPRQHAQARFIEIAREGGIQSIPYDIAIRHNSMHKHGQRPVAKRTRKKGDQGANSA